MNGIQEYLNQLQIDKETLKTNLINKGIKILDTDTFTEMSAKVADIQSGGGNLNDYFVFKNPNPYPETYDVHNGPESNFDRPEIIACTGSWTNMINNFPFEKVDFSNYGTYDYIFAGYNGKTIDVSSLPLSRNADMMFGCAMCKNFKKFINMNNHTFDNIYITIGTFYGCESLEELIDYNNFRYSNNASYMFYNCITLSKVLLCFEYMYEAKYMFHNTNISEVDLRVLNNVENAYHMFHGASIDTLNMISFDFTNKSTNDLQEMFYNSSINRLIVKNEEQQTHLIDAGFYAEVDEFNSIYEESIINLPSEIEFTIEPYTHGCHVMYQSEYGDNGGCDLLDIYIDKSYMTVRYDVCDADGNIEVLVDTTYLRDGDSYKYKERNNQSHTINVNKTLYCSAYQDHGLYYREDLIFKNM